jgi:hypothetical protein
VADENPAFTLGASRRASAAAAAGNGAAAKAAAAGNGTPGGPPAAKTDAPDGGGRSRSALAAPRRIVPRDKRRVMTLSDYWDDRMKGRYPLDRLEGIETLKGLLGALGFDAPREMYYPSPEQHAFRMEKTLTIVPRDISPSDGPRKDCSVRVCGPRSCLVYVKRLEVTPLNLTAQESLVVRFGLHCGTQKTIIDFCEVVSQANESAGQYTKPQHFLIPPTGCLVVDFYNEDEFSEALVSVEAEMWLVPDKEDA